MVKKLRIAFIHPDLGIGGAERLVVDAALGLQNRGHDVDIYTSHHDPGHCFEETRDGTLKVHHIRSPFPRSFRGRLHILFAHLRQLHLTFYLLGLPSPLLPEASQYDIFFVDQLSTCVPLLRLVAGKRVLFYCHFPDKLLATGESAEDTDGPKKPSSVSLLKRLYRMPMDWLEEVTTGQADVLLANSYFTARIFKAHFPSIRRVPRVVYPGINISAYSRSSSSPLEKDRCHIVSDRPTFLSLNRFERKKNAALAVEAFARLRTNSSKPGSLQNLDHLRLVLAGGYDPRLQDNVSTLNSLLELASNLGLAYSIVSPSTLPSTVQPTSSPDPDIVFLLNFTTTQRTSLLTSPRTLALLYTPTNEHFGIGPVEGMICGLPVLACRSGGPKESVVDPSVSDAPPESRTGWLRNPDVNEWSVAMEEIVNLAPEERRRLSETAKRRAKENFSLETMAEELEKALGEGFALGTVSRVGASTILAILTVLLMLLSLKVML